MRSPMLFAAVLLASSLSALCAEDASAPARERGVWPAMKRTWHSTVEGAGAAAKSTGSVVKSATGSVVGLFEFGSKGKSPAKLPIKINVQFTPNPLVLRDAKKLTVRVLAVNEGKRAQLLEFNSGLRADAVLRDSQGHIVARSSPEEPQSGEPGMVTLNAGEKLEYVLSLPTAALNAGRVYTLEAALVGQDGLVARSEIQVQ